MTSASVCQRETVKSHTFYLGVFIILLCQFIKHCIECTVKEAATDGQIWRYEERGEGKEELSRMGKCKIRVSESS